MQIFLLSLFIFCIQSTVFCQKANTKTVAKFIITDATENGVDITPHLLREEAFLAFYTKSGDELLYMANVWPKSKSQSYGPVYSIKSETLEETSESYEADIFRFNWRYQNTYNTKKGTAKVEVTKIYKPQGIFFTIKLVPENLDLLIYKGYMEGTVDFSIFD